jgi:hypothetical protein
MRGRGEIGRRNGLKIRFFIECGFESRRPHQYKKGFTKMTLINNLIQKMLEDKTLKSALEEMVNHELSEFYTPSVIHSFRAKLTHGDVKFRITVEMLNKSNNTEDD